MEMTEAKMKLVAEELRYVKGYSDYKEPRLGVGGYLITICLLVVFKWIIQYQVAQDSLRLGVEMPNLLPIWLFFDIIMALVATLRLMDVGYNSGGRLFLSFVVFVVLFDIITMPIPLMIPIFILYMIIGEPTKPTNHKIIKDMENGEFARKELDRAISRVEENSAESREEPSDDYEDNSYNDLRALKELYDEGVISKEEFEKKKKKVLDI